MLSFRRTIAASAALLLLACTLFASWHRAAEFHVRCEEHGVEIELRRLPGSVDGLGAATSEQPVLRSSPWEIASSDAHCEILAGSHEPTTTHVASAFAVMLAALHQQPTPVAVPAPRTVLALHRLAPKTSPPRAV